MAFKSLNLKLQQSYGLGRQTEALRGRAPSSNDLLAPEKEHFQDELHWGRQRRRWFGKWEVIRYRQFKISIPWTKQLGQQREIRTSTSPLRKRTFSEESSLSKRYDSKSWKRWSMAKIWPWGFYKVCPPLTPFPIIKIGGPAGQNPPVHFLWDIGVVEGTLYRSPMVNF